MENNKIKILHFPIRNSNGGVTRFAMNLWRFIDHDKFQFGFATCSKHLDFEQRIIEEGCKVHYISCYAEENAEQFCRELKEILADGYDAIHIQTNWWKSFYAEQVAREVGIKVILIHAANTFVDVNDDEERKKEIIIHEKCKNSFPPELATHYIACSKEAADFLYGSQIPRNKIDIFHYALDINRFQYNEEKRNSIRKNLNLSDKFVIGNVGRMAYQKNHKFLIDCFYEVQKKEDKAVLLLLGDGYLEKEIKDQVTQYGIGEKVIFAGAVDNVEDYLQAMDIFAFPTRFEGLGIVLIEAQAAGLKCIAGDKVPRETELTENIVYLELNKEKWVEEILRYKGGYHRVKTGEQIRRGGYDITQEIKRLEKIYLTAER
ncbi:MAG: glycosyltransferase [Ruminococcus flavefaciens]|nr:glycosyltransferase [Roseburia sp.]MCM1231460.1 glycosyltransferase [Ruminococcus flavefaciens]